MPLASGITHHWIDGSAANLNDVVGSENGTLAGSSANFWDKVDRDGNPVAQFLTAAANSISWNGLTAVDFPSGSFSVLVAFWHGQSVQSGGAEQCLQWNQGGVGGFVFNYNDSHPGILLRLINGGVNHDLSLDIREYFEDWVIFQFGWDSGANTSFFRVNENEQAGSSITVAAPSTATLKFGGGGVATFGRLADVIIWDGKSLSSSERDDNFSHLWDGRLHGTAPTILNTDDTITKTIINQQDHGDSTLGNKNLNQGSIQSNATKIWIVGVQDDGPVSVGQETSKVHQYDRTNWPPGTKDETFQLPQVNQDTGHNTCALGIDDEDRLLIIQGDHNAAWNAYRSDNPNDTTPNTAEGKPSWIGAGDLLTYPSIRRMPADNSLWMMVRERNSPGGGDWAFQLGKRNQSTDAWDQIGGAKFWDGSSFPEFVHLAGHPTDANKVYHSVAWRQGGNDNPDHSFGVVYTDDGGTTWKHLDGTTVTPSLSHTDATQIGPRSTPLGSTDAEHDISADAQIAVDDQGTLHAAWGHKNETRGDNARHLYYGRWNSTSESFDRWQFHVRSPDTGNAGPSCHITWNPTNNNLYIINRDGDGGTDGIVYLWASGDRGNTWTRYILHTETAGQRTGRYHRPDDYEMQVQGRYRFTVRDDLNTDSDQIWDFTPPIVGAALFRSMGDLSGMGSGGPFFKDPLQSIG